MCKIGARCVRDRCEMCTRYVQDVYEIRAFNHSMKMHNNKSNPIKTIPKQKVRGYKKKTEKGESCTPHLRRRILHDHVQTDHQWMPERLTTVNEMRQRLRKEKSWSRVALCLSRRESEGEGESRKKRTWGRRKRRKWHKVNF